MVCRDFDRFHEVISALYDERAFPAPVPDLKIRSPMTNSPRFNRHCLYEFLYDLVLAWARWLRRC